MPTYAASRANGTPLTDVPGNDRRLGSVRLMISAMSDSSYSVPASDSASMPSALTTEQELLADSARDEVQAFLGSPAGEIHEAAETATTALEDAVDAHVPVADLSAALNASPEAVQAIIDHDIDLEDLHPENNVD